MLSPSESFADIEGDRFRFHLQALLHRLAQVGTIVAYLLSMPCVTSVPIMENNHLATGDCMQSARNKTIPYNVEK